MKKTKKLTITALLAALSVMVLYLGSIIPSGQLGFAAIGCVLGIVAVIQCGMAWAAGLYVVCSLLALLLLPNKTTAILYAAFFGYYPLIKSLAEHIPHRVLEWCVKLALFNASLCALMFLFTVSFLPESVEQFPQWAIILVLNVVFILFDIGLSRLISLYMARLHKHIK